MLGFAVLYFGVMNDAGLFSPVIRAVVRGCEGDPLRLVVGTAIVAMLAHLDGSGASTFLIAIPALLPVYDRMGLDRRVLACTVCAWRRHDERRALGRPDAEGRRLTPGRC